MNRKTDCTPERLTNLTNGLVAKYTQIPTAILQSVVKSMNTTAVITANRDWGHVYWDAAEKRM